MAYYLLPKSWRHSLESKFFTPKQRKFIDAGERVNRYGFDIARGIEKLFIGGPRRRGIDIVDSRPAGRTRSGTKYQPSTPRRSAPPKVPSTPSKKRPHSAKRKSIPRKKRPRLDKMSKVARIIGQGHYHGKFSRPKKRVKRVKYPCICKDEQSFTYTGEQCVYVAHATHPPRYIVRMMAMSMVHKYFQQMGIWITNWLDPAGVRTGLGTSAEPIGLKCFAYYQPSINGALGADPLRLELCDLAVGDTYLDYADKLATGLISMVTSSTTDLMVTQLQWISGTPGSINVTYRVWDATEIRIAIYAKSMLNVQNRTAGGDVAGTNLTTSIYANPLHGKQYSCKGFGARVKDLGVAINASRQLAPDTGTGLANLQIDTLTGANLSAAAVDALKQPVLPNYFKNCKGSSYIRLEPGAIKKSTCYTTVTKSLNGWLRSGFQWLFDATSIPTIRSNVNSFIGETKIIALEKVADVGADNDIVLAGERDATYMSKMTFSKKRFTVPTNASL